MSSTRGLILMHHQQVSKEKRQNDVTRRVHLCTNQHVAVVNFGCPPPSFIRMNMECVTYNGRKAVEPPTGNDNMSVRTIYSTS